MSISFILKRQHAKYRYLGPDYCTYEEAIMLRNELRAIGPERFCAEYVESGRISAKKVLTAFSIKRT